MIYWTLEDFTRRNMLSVDNSRLVCDKCAQFASNRIAKQLQIRLRALSISLGDHFLFRLQSLDSSRAVVSTTLTLSRLHWSLADELFDCITRTGDTEKCLHVSPLQTRCAFLATPRAWACLETFYSLTSLKLPSRVTKSGLNWRLVTGPASRAPFPKLRTASERNFKS